MKIKLNESNKIDITFGVACSLTAIDMLATELGMLVTMNLLCKAKAKTGAFIGWSALYLIATAAKLPEEYSEAIWNISEKSCNWVFNKLEKSNQKVIEFEK